MSKGAVPRPLSVSKQTWDGEYDRIFKIDMKKIEQRVIDNLTRKDEEGK